MMGKNQSEYHKIKKQREQELAELETFDQQETYYERPDNSITVGPDTEIMKAGKTYVISKIGPKKPMSADPDDDEYYCDIYLPTIEQYRAGNKDGNDVLIMVSDEFLDMVHDKWILVLTEEERIEQIINKKGW